jgi:hypothetical protein
MVVRHHDIGSVAGRDGRSADDWLNLDLLGGHL